jgi:hypothetical protein
MQHSCDNTLRITGAQSDTTAFIGDQRISEDVPLSFATTVPPPETLPSDWAVVNWGCTQDLVEPKLKGTTFTFSSTLCPPIPWLKALSQRYAALLFTISYAGEDDTYSGSMTIQNKRLLSFTGDGKSVFAKSLS